MTLIYEAKHSPKSVEAKMASIATAQFGVISRTQALDLGVDGNAIDRRLKAGTWKRLHPGVYQLAGSPVSWRQSLVAACLACGPLAVVSHAAAARLWFIGFETARVELTVPRGRKRANGLRVHQVRTLPRVDVTKIDGIPITTATRTMLDIAGCAPRDLVEEALDDALRRKLVTIPRLRWRLSELRSPGRAGTKLLEELIAARSGARSAPQSRLETRMLRLVRQARLPRPELQHEIKVRGHLIAVLDFAYPERKVAIETDGYRWHSSRRHWEHDRVRLNALQVEGWTVLHFTWERLKEHPDAVVREIRAALAGERRADLVP